VPYEDVPAYLQSSAVYAQFSLHETFCRALAEGMACGCTPAITPCTALPEVAGDTAYYAGPGDIKASAEAIRKALDGPRGIQARERVVQLFPLSRRREALRQHVQDLLG
jgi:glycosyltransferase involved in cell wall biosynthesis